MSRWTGTGGAWYVPPMPNTMKFLVFTDLDGTLLDHDTYSFAAAAPALELLRQRNVPLIAVTSKTRAELEALPAVTSRSGVFITENGGGIFFVRRPGDEIPGRTDRDGDYDVIRLGQPYTSIRERLHRAAAQTGAVIRGFGDMDAAEIAERTGLDEAAAARAAMREFSEPFVLSTGDDAALVAACAAAGLSCVRGGRFWHAMAHPGKGEALLRVRAVYAARDPQSSFISVALGDSPNDLPLLEAADIPVAVRRPDGSHMPLPAELAERVTITAGVGPAGWNEAMLSLMTRRRHHE